MNAKLLLCLLLLSGGLFASAQAARTNPIADQPQPTQSSNALEFDSIHMVDRQIGWAQPFAVLFAF